MGFAYDTMNGEIPISRPEKKLEDHSTITAVNDPNIRDYPLNEYSYLPPVEKFTHCKITLYTNLGDIIKVYDGNYNILSNLPDNIIFKDIHGNMYYIYNTTGLAIVEIDAN